MVIVTKLAKSKSKAFLLTIAILLLVILLLVSVLLRRSSFSSLSVERRKIVDEIGREVRLEGFVLWEEAVLHSSTMGGGIEKWGEYTKEDCSIIKQWGFNLVQLFCRWRHLEPYRDKPGQYSESAFRHLKNHVQMAQEAGLYVVMSLCTHFEPAGGIYEADDLLDVTMRERYYDLVRYWVDRCKGYDNVIGFMPLHYPWHAVYDPDDTRKAVYRSIIAPDLLRVCRGRTDKIVFISPIWECPDYLEDLSGLIGEPNLAFTTEFASGIKEGGEGRTVLQPDDLRWRWHIITNRISYDGEKERLRALIKPAYDFSVKYNVPILNPEWKIHVHKMPRPVPQDKLLFVQHKLEIMQEYDIHWTYWNYCKGVDLGVLELDGSPVEELIALLRSQLK